MDGATNKARLSVMGSFNVFSTFTGNKWKLNRIGAGRAIKIYKNKQDAIKRGMELAKKNKRDLYIQAENGDVLKKHSYRPDKNH